MNIPRRLKLWYVIGFDPFISSINYYNKMNNTVQRKHEISTETNSTKRYFF